MRTTELGNETAIKIKRIDLAKWIPLFIWLGVPSLGTGLAYFRGPIMGWLVKPAIEAQTRDAIPLERARTDSLVKAEVRGPVKTLSRQVGYLQALIEEMPEGKKAAARIKQRDNDRIFQPAEARQE